MKKEYKEIKLKDMTDFLENFYKDIKKQPTLEEELEKERKFINKIKGDKGDEIKELLEHIEILDNTDYILHSDKAKKLLDYITNLQEENKDLKELCDKYELEHNTTFKLWKMKMEEMPTYEEKIEIQKENERLKEKENKLQEKFKDWKKEIEKERKHYLCDRTDCCGRIKNSRKYNSIYQELKTCKSRCEKAIEHIKEHQLIYTSQYEEESNFDNHLLDILNGGDEE